MSRRALWLLGALCAGCANERLDLLTRVGTSDACETFTDESACNAQTALRCRYQPNSDGCQQNDPNCAPGMCRSGDPFVRVRDRSFFLNGAPFRFVGVSSWAMLQPAPCAGVPAGQREAWVEDAYDGLVPARAKVARFLAPQSSAGPSGTDFKLLDAAVRGARRAGIRLQIILETSSIDCSSPVPRDSAWYNGGYREREATYALPYLEYALNVVTQYKDEPTVLGYVLMHGLGGADASALTNFVSDMAPRLHGIAPDQLLSLDLVWPGAGEEAATYRALQSLPAVDFMDVDDYTSPQPLDPTLLDLLAEIDKPAVVGEGAFNLTDGSEADLRARADAAAQRMQEWKGWGFSGALLWAYDPGWTAPSEEFDARRTDPLLQAGGVLDHAPF